MELINWSLNAIDQIFTTRRSGKGEPACPDGTFAAGYMLDSWGSWRQLCLAILSMEDVEDLYILGFMIAGMLLIGAGSFLIYRKVEKTREAALGRLPIVTEGLCRALNAQTQAINELKSTILERLREIGSILEDIRIRLGS